MTLGKPKINLKALIRSSNLITQTLMPSWILGELCLDTSCKSSEIIKIKLWHIWNSFNMLMCFFQRMFTIIYIQSDEECSFNPVVLRVYFFCIYVKYWVTIRLFHRTNFYREFPYFWQVVRLQHQWILPSWLGMRLGIAMMMMIQLLIPFLWPHPLTRQEAALPPVLQTKVKH